MRARMKALGLAICLVYSCRSSPPGDSRRTVRSHPAAPAEPGLAAELQTIAVDHQLAVNLSEGFSARPVCVGATSPGVTGIPSPFAGDTTDPSEAVLRRLRSAGHQVFADSECGGPESNARRERMTVLVWWPVASGDDAVTMVERRCGWPCSRGMRVFLHRSGNRWQVVRHEMAGVS